MPDYTGNLNLAKPIPNEDSADIRVINENMDKIDEWSKNIEPAFEKKSGFNKNKSDETNLKDSETLATSMAVAKTMEKAEEALNSAGGKEPAFNKNTAFNKNFGTGQNEVLEGSKLAEILGIEYGGVLNNSNQKIAGKGYYDTANKKIYKCTTNTSINYADAGYFIEVSNNDLLGKLQNLFTVRDETNGYIILDNGIIIQWLRVSGPVDITNTSTLPTPFKKGFFQGTICYDYPQDPKAMVVGSIAPNGLDKISWASHFVKGESTTNPLMRVIVIGK